MATIKTARLRLRPVQEADVDTLHGIWTDPDVRRFLWDNVEIDRPTANAVVERSGQDWRDRGYGLWIVDVLAAREPAGFIGLRSSDEDPDPELLFGLLPRFWHQGLVTEAGHAALTHLFESDPRIARAWGATDTPNQASVRVMERLGMTFSRRGTLNGLDTLFFDIDRQRFAAASQGRSVASKGDFA